MTFEFQFIHRYVNIQVSGLLYLDILLTGNFSGKWAMIGAIAFIFLLLPESPWWLVSKGKLDKAAKVLTFCNGKVDGYDVQEQVVRELLWKWSQMVPANIL